MSEIKVTLIHGFKLGDTVLKKVVLREATAGDVIEAHEESEKLVMVPDDKNHLQPQFVPSPTMVGVHVLRRQIKSVDDISGPFDVEQIKALHPEDLNLLQHEANKMDAAAEQVAQELTTRGEPEQSGEEH